MRELITMIVQAVAEDDLYDMIEKSTEVVNHLVAGKILIEDTDGIIDVDMVALQKIIDMCNGSEEAIVKSFISGAISLWGHIDNTELVRETH